MNDGGIDLDEFLPVVEHLLEDPSMLVLEVHAASFVSKDVRGDLEVVFHTKLRNSDLFRNGGEVVDGLFILYILAAQTHAEERVSQDISLPVLKQTELHIVHLHRRFLLAAYTRIRLLRLSFSLHIQYLLILLIQELQAIARVLVVVGFSVAGVAKRPSHVVNLSVLQKLDHVHRNDLLLRIRSIPSDPVSYTHLTLPTMSCV